MAAWFHPVREAYMRILRGGIRFLAYIACASVIGMMLVTCSDVVMRALGYPLKGSYDLVGLLGLVAISCSLPYTTALKGHVAVEFFFNKMPRILRIAVDSLMRVLMIALFCGLAYQNVKYAMSFRASGELMPTLRWPVFWVPYVISFSCAVSALVVLHNLIRPGKVMMKP